MAYHKPYRHLSIHRSTLNSSFHLFFSINPEQESKLVSIFDLYDFPHVSFHLVRKKVLLLEHNGNSGRWRGQPQVFNRRRRLEMKEDKVKRFKLTRQIQKNVENFWPSFGLVEISKIVKVNMSSCLSQFLTKCTRSSI